MEKSFFQLLEQNIINVEFVKNENYSNEREISLEFNYQTEININENNTANVILDFSIFNKECLKEYPFYIKVVISGIFTWDKDTNNEILQELLQFNAPAVLLSYIRTMISTLTAFSGYPALIIPLMNFKK